MRGLDLAARATLACGLLLCASSAAAQDSTHRAHSMGWGRETFVLLDALEIAGPRNRKDLNVEITGWTGGPVHRFWFGVDAFSEPGSMPLALEGHYGRLVAPFWDMQLGIWYETDLDALNFREHNGGISMGMHGLAPGWFEVEGALRVSVQGDLAIQLRSGYDLYLTQRLVLDPRVDAVWHPLPVREHGIAAGVSEVAVGARLRWEVRRRFAPYVGLGWERTVSDFDFIPAPAVAKGRVVRVGLRAWW